MAGYAYHVLNRANGRMQIFDDAGDYEAFERVLNEAVERTSMRLLSYCVMPNHWHLVVWPREDGDLSRFVGWLSLTHTQRWHAHRRTVGYGHVYQGRYKSFVIERDEHLFTVCRYAERNAMRAGMVERAELWRWSSLWRWVEGDAASRALLSDWPTADGKRPRNWLSTVNRPETAAELKDLRRSVERSQPYGGASWTNRMIAQLGLESTARPRGRPRRENGT